MKKEAVSAAWISQVKKDTYSLTDTATKKPKTVYREIPLIDHTVIVVRKDTMLIQSPNYAPLTQEGANIINLTRFVSNARLDSF